MFADAEPLGPIVPSAHVTGPVPVQPADADTKVVPAGRVSTVDTPLTAASPEFCTVTVYCTLLPAVTGSGVPVIDVDRSPSPPPPPSLTVRTSLHTDADVCVASPL